MSLPSTDVAYLCWSDYVGITRCRGVPAADLSKRMDKGLGWAAAGQALTPFDDIADNPWGPMTEVRQTPQPETKVRLDLWPGTPAWLAASTARGSTSTQTQPAGARPKRSQPRR